MPFERPDLATLVRRNKANMQSRLGVGAALRRTLCDILARMDAGQAHGLYGYLDWLSRQLFAASADYDFLCLHGNFWGVFERLATAATGTAPVTGTPGAILPAGSVYKRIDGIEYTVDADIIIPASGATTAAITCMSEGKTGNADAGVPLQLAVPALGVQPETTTTEAISGGTEGEGEDSYRARILAAKRKPARGGNDEDYIFWVQEVAGFTRAWVRRNALGKGTVAVFAMMDDTYEDGLPRPGDIARLQAHLDAVAPCPAEVFAFAPTGKPLDLDIRVTPDTPAVRAAVAASVAKTIRRDAIPGAAIMLSRLNEAISIAEGEEDHTLLAPTANVPHDKDEIAIPGAILWGDEETGNEA